MVAEEISSTQKENKVQDPLEEILSWSENRREMWQREARSGGCCVIRLGFCWATVT